MTATSIRVAMACHERVERTLGCLRSLAAQTGLEAVDVRVSLVDADSADGTADAVEHEFPDVTVLRRRSDLYWNSGMRVALADAATSDPDRYLWLNDDVVLDPDAIARLLDADQDVRDRGRPPSIIVGSTRDPVTGNVTYGGVHRPRRSRPLRYELVDPDQLRRVETMNGNVVLVPRAVFSRVGTLAAAYTHGMGDYDYGHRATRAGCEVWVAAGTFGTCARNAPRPSPTSVSEHRARATGVTTGLPPREWFTFARRWAGPLWPVYGLSPYLRRWWRWQRR